MQSLTLKGSLFLILSIVGVLPAVAAANEDSLQQIIAAHPNDTTGVNTMINLADIYRRDDPQKAKDLIERARLVSRDLLYVTGMIKSTFLMAYFNWGDDEPDSAVSWAGRCIKLSEKSPGNEAYAGKSCLIIGSILIAQSEFEDALKIFIKGSAFYNEAGNEDGKASCLSNIGLCNDYMGRYDQALQYYLEALELRKKNDSPLFRIAGITNNVGEVYREKHDYSNALIYYKKALDINTEIQNKIGVAYALDNLSLVYLETDSLTKALDYSLQAERYFKELGKTSEQATNLSNLAKIYMRLGDLDKALEIANKELALADSLKTLEARKEAYNTLAVVLEARGAYPEALQYLWKHIHAKDSLINEENQKTVSELNARFETEKDKARIAMLEKDNTIKGLEVEKANSRKVFYLSGVVMLLVLGLILLLAYRTKIRANRLLADQNKHIQEINKDITDSIRYAQRIQEAMLPPKKLFTELFPDGFILYRPKHIVSGDFFWIKEFDNKLAFSVVDCTGHGVPGAFMSIIGYNALEQCIDIHKLDQPAAILNQLNQLVNHALRKEGTDVTVRDGMDLALCVFDRATSVLSYSGAHNPLVIIRADGAMEIIPADRRPIGRYLDKEEFSFTQKETKIFEEDRVYLYSDGYIDQFGGPMGKKFKSRQFRQLLLNTADKPFSEQNTIIEHKLIEWMGQLEQIDDICVMGVKLG